MIQSRAVCDSIEISLNNTCDPIKTYNITCYLNSISIGSAVCIINTHPNSIYVSVHDMDSKYSSLTLPFLKSALQSLSDSIDIRNIRTINLSLPDSLIIDMSKKITPRNHRKDILPDIKKEIEQSNFTERINGILKEYSLKINKIDIEYIYYIDKDIFIKEKKLKGSTDVLPPEILQLQLFYVIQQIK